MAETSSWRVGPLRWLVVALTIVVVIAQAWFVVAGIARNDVARDGFATASPGLTIVSVLPGSAAARAGMRVGDELAIDRMELRDVLHALGITSKTPGDEVHVVVRRAGTELAAVLQPQPLYADAATVGIVAFDLLEIVLIAALVLVVLVRYPRSDALVLWAIAAPWTLRASFLGYHFAADRLVAAIWPLWDGAVAGLASAGALLLALVATGTTAHRREAVRAAIAAGIAVAAVIAAADVMLLQLRVAPPPALAIADQYAFLPVVAIVGWILIAALRRTVGAERVRLRWVIVGLTLFACQPILATAVPVLAPGALYALWFGVLALALTLAAFAALAFAIARNELFDVGFVVNRTAIYATMTALLVAVFAALNWFMGTALKATGLALPAEILIAGGLGLSLHLVQRRLDRAIELLFFRKRFDVRNRLARVARGLIHVTSEPLVAQTVVREACEALELAGGALFRRAADGRFRRVAALGWDAGTAEEIAADDRLIVHLAGVDDYVRLDAIPHEAALPHGHPRPRIAFPLWNQGQLAGIALFSAHRNGAALDPEEVDAVERIVSAASSAFDRLDAEALRIALREVEALRAELLRRLAPPG